MECAHLFDDGCFACDGGYGWLGGNNVVNGIFAIERCGNFRAVDTLEIHVFACVLGNIFGIGKANFGKECLGGESWNGRKVNNGNGLASELSDSIVRCDGRCIFAQKVQVAMGYNSHHFVLVATANKLGCQVDR